VKQDTVSTRPRPVSRLSELVLQDQLWLLAKRLSGGAVGPLLSFVALFALPVLGAIALDIRDFAFWSLLSTIATVALMLDFGGVALVVARFYSEPRGRLLVKSSALSATGALAIGIVACIIWIPYSHTEMGRSIPAMTAIAALLTMSVAAAIRSVLTVVAQAALVASQLALRNVATAGHAFAAVLTTTALLFSTHSFWALPLGWLVSGVLVMCVVFPWAWRTRGSESAEAVIVQPFNWRHFAGLRTLSTVIAAVVLNADRWIVGALGGPALLAAYELAWRFAVLPRFLVTNLVLRVGADVSSLGRSDERRLAALLRGSTVIAAVAGSLSCVPVALAYWAFMSFTGAEPHWPIFLAMVAAFTVWSVATPLSLSGATVGNAWIDIPYGIGVLATSGVIAVVAAHFARSDIFIYGYLAAIVVGVFFFYLYAPVLVRRGLETREAIEAVETIGRQ
jgi:O-antigen/teichoic acid export membrane protein